MVKKQPDEITWNGVKLNKVLASNAKMPAHYGFLKCLGLDAWMEGTCPYCGRIVIDKWMDGSKRKKFCNAQHGSKFNKRRTA